MDPLSISTGIITLLQATNAIISICYNYRAALKDTPWSLTSVVNELKSLRNILEGLEEICGRNDQHPKHGFTFHSLATPDTGPFAICLQELKTLDTKIQASYFAGAHGSKRRAATQALRWQLKDKDAEECLARLERCKTTLSLALSADQSKLLLCVREQTASVQATSQNIDYKVTMIDENLRSKQSNEERRALMKWLSPVDPCENHEAAVLAHQEGTSSWLLGSDVFQKWLETSSSFLWLNGLPGAGKTVLFSQLVVHVTQNQDIAFDKIAVAYFYCDFTESDFHRAENVAGSLVAQLCSQFALPDQLLQAYKDSQSRNTKRRPSWKLLKDILLFFSEHRKILLFVDALDECENRGELLQLLGELHLEGNISTLVTSRLEPDIQDAFQELAQFELASHQSEVERDIESYIDKRLVDDLNLRKLSCTVKADIKCSLMNKCAGMFRWAQCQLDTLSQLRTVRSIRQNLDRLPKGLHETYANMLKRVDENDVELLRRALLWVAFAVMPLTLEELGESVAIESGISTLDEIKESRLTDVTDVLKIGRSLLSITPTGHVKLAHLSVRDYLLSIDIQSAPSASMFALDLKEGNQELAINCIIYLSLDTLASGPANTSDDWQARLENHPMLMHAAKGWTYYVREGNKTEELSALVSGFFAAESRNIFMSWIQILNSNWIFKWDDYPKHATPLYYASSFGLEDIVEKLIQDGVDVNAPGSRFGGTALHGATLREHISVMETLLGAGADPCKADFNRITPLHTAARIGNGEIIELLLKFGASKDAQDSLGESPYDWAEKSAQEVSQKLLRGEQCDIQSSRRTRRDSPIYERAAASFPALAMAQGLTPRPIMEKL